MLPTMFHHILWPYVSNENNKQQYSSCIGQGQQPYLSAWLKKYCMLNHCLSSGGIQHVRSWRKTYRCHIDRVPHEYLDIYDRIYMERRRASLHRASSNFLLLSNHHTNACSAPAGTRVPIYCELRFLPCVLISGKSSVLHPLDFLGDEV
jgi:hypothetical protein